MANLLTRLIEKQKWGGMGFYIYFAPDNAATRFDIVAAAFQCTVDDWFDLDIAFKAEEEWRVFSNALRHARHSRNEVIHGAVREIEVGRAKRPIIRLTASAYDPHRHRGKQGEAFGRSPADVERAAEKIKALTTWARLFAKYAHAYHGQHEELPSIFAELERHRLKHGIPDERDLTPPKR